MARLSTHVLDTARGTAAHGIRVQVHRLHGSTREPIADVRTNAQGRTDAPLMAGERIEPGVYELTFHVGDYFRQQQGAASSLPFLDLIPIRVGLGDPAGEYHVPLILSPHGYTTYRGT